MAHFKIIHSVLFITDSPVIRQFRCLSKYTTKTRAAKEHLDISRSGIAESKVSSFVRFYKLSLKRRHKRVVLLLPAFPTELSSSLILITTRWDPPQLREWKNRSSEHWNGGGAEGRGQRDLSPTPRS